MRPLRFDFDAALWLSVAFVASAFGIFPVLLAGLAMTGAALDGLAYTVANASVVALAFAVATGALVTVAPSRRVRDLVFTLWLLGVVATGALAVLQFVSAPRAVLKALITLAAPLTFGVLQLDSVAPLRFGPADPWALIGVLLGVLLARGILSARGREFGAAAEHDVTPMRLPGSRAGGGRSTR